MENTLTVTVLDDAVRKQVDQSIIFFSQLYCSNSFRNRNVLGVFVFFQLEGGTGGLSALLSPCLFELFKFCREAVCFPPIFLKLHDSPAKSNRACWGTAAPRALHSCALLPHVQVCSCVCTLVLSVLWQNSWRYTFKKMKKKKNKGSMAINSFKKTMENSA